MENSDNLQLPYIAPSQAQKHVTHNEAIRALDAILQLSVVNRALSAPPGSPQKGERYIVGAGATGEWASQDNSIAAYQDGAWAFYPPVKGWRAWIEAESIIVVWDGASWISANSGAENVNPTPFVGVNATADATNRLHVQSDAALFSYDAPNSGTDSRLTINKSAVADTASIIFQTGFSGRAELGLTGDDDFHVKVSPDGAAWQDCLVIDKDAGNIAIGHNTPDCALHIIKDTNPVAKFSRGSDNVANVNLYYNTTLKGQFSAAASEFQMSGAGAGTSLSFYAGGSRRLEITDGGSLLVGSPVGGAKGAGTINAQAVYDDNMLLSCYVFDQALDNAIDDAKWDAKAQKIFANEPNEKQAIAARHEPMRKFKARIGSAYDPLTLDGYARHWREKRHLAAMPNETSFNPHADKLSAGEWVQRLVETVEVQAILIEQLNQRTKDLARHNEESTKTGSK